MKLNIKNYRIKVSVDNSMAGLIGSTFSLSKNSSQYSLELKLLADTFDHATLSIPLNKEATDKEELFSNNETTTILIGDRSSEIKDVTEKIKSILEQTQMFKSKRLNKLSIKIRINLNSLYERKSTKLVKIYPKWTAW